MEDKALNYRKQIKVGAADVGATIEKLKKQQFQYATAGDARRLIEEIERLREESNELSICCEYIGSIRVIVKERLGLNTTFVDDDVRLACKLAQRAVLAGLATDAQPATLKRLTNAAEQDRFGHEDALKRALPPPETTE